jgi:hypothetical protein
MSDIKLDIFIENWENCFEEARGISGDKYTIDRISMEWFITRVKQLQSALTTAQEENKRYMDALCDFENKNKDITSRCAKNVIRIEVLERALEKYEAAIKEAEAILGGEYAMQYGPFFDLVQDAQSALNGGKNG